MFKEVKRKMTKKIEMADWGLMTYYLGIEVKQGEEGIFLSQKTYAEEILKEFKMDAINSVATLVECGTKISKFDNTEKVNPTLFRRIVGRLRFLTCTRLDIMYAVGVISRYMESPTLTHMKVTKRII